MQASLTFQQFLAILRQRWIWIGSLMTAIMGITVLFTLFVVKPVYSNSATLLITQQQTEPRMPLTFDELLLNEKLLGTYKEIINSRRILQPIAESRQVSFEQLRSWLTVSVNANSQVLALTVQHERHSLATDLANDIAGEVVVRLKEIMPLDNIVMLDRAVASDSPSPIKPNKKLNLMLALIVGTVVSISTALLRHYMDTTIQEAEHVADLMGYPIVGSIPPYPKRSQGGPLS